MDEKKNTDKMFSNFIPIYAHQISAKSVNKHFFYKGDDPLKAQYPLL